MSGGTRPFFKSSGVLLWSPYASPPCGAMNIMYFIRLPKSLNPSVAKVSDHNSVP